MQSESCIWFNALRRKKAPYQIGQHRECITVLMDDAPHTQPSIWLKYVRPQAGAEPKDP